MGKLNLSTGNEVEQLSTDIDVITAEINMYQRQAGESIFEIGRRLKHVKENDITHGGFMDWYESNGMTKDFVSKAIKIADSLADFETSRNSIGIEALYQIALLPEGSRDLAFKEDGTAKPVRKIRELKRQLKAEQAERERLERENEELASRDPEIRVETKTEYIDAVDASDADVKQLQGSLNRAYERIEELERVERAVAMQEGSPVNDVIRYLQSCNRTLDSLLHDEQYAKRVMSTLDRGVIQTLVSEQERAFTKLELLSELAGDKADGSIIDVDFEES